MHIKTLTLVDTGILFLNIQIDFIIRIGFDNCQLSLFNQRKISLEEDRFLLAANI